MSAQQISVNPEISRSITSWRKTLMLMRVGQVLAGLAVMTALFSVIVPQQSGVLSTISPIVFWTAAGCGVVAIICIRSLMTRYVAATRFLKHAVKLHLEEPLFPGLDAAFEQARQIVHSGLESLIEEDRSPNNSRAVSSLISKYSESALTIFQIAFVIISSLFIGICSISPLRESLISGNHLPDNVLLATADVALGLNLVLTIHLSRTLGRSSRATAPVPPVQSAIIPNGVGEVYEALHSALRAARNSYQKRLDVLGLTLYSAWPQIGSWILADPLNGWIIDFYCLDPEFVQTNIVSIQTEWGEQAATNINSIKRFMKDHEDELAIRGIKVSLTVYKSFPGIHGFRVASGDLFVSCTHWSQENVLADPTSFYEWFTKIDQTDRATLYRGLFDNWLQHARSTSPKNNDVVTTG